jgi:uncharacterized protein YlxW (UPF0749 family)
VSQNFLISLDYASVNALISKLENNVTELEEQYTDLQDLIENLTARLGSLEQSLNQDASGLHQRLNELLEYVNCVAYATENNFRISEQCPFP